MKLLTLPLLLGLLSACGVKTPPVPPVRPPEPVPQVLDCSPYDENCDVQDPDYRPVGP